jgi:hypothetical protein
MSQTIEETVKAKHETVASSGLSSEHSAIAEGPGTHRKSCRLLPKYLTKGNKND